MLASVLQNMRITFHSASYAVSYQISMLVIKQLSIFEIFQKIRLFTTTKQHVT